MELLLPLLAVLAFLTCLVSVLEAVECEGGECHMKLKDGACRWTCVSCGCAPSSFDGKGASNGSALCSKVRLICFPSAELDAGLSTAWKDSEWFIDKEAPKLAIEGSTKVAANRL